MGPSPEAKPDIVAAVETVKPELPTEVVDKEFAEITAQPDLAELDAVDPVREEMASDARARIAELSDEALLKAENMLRASKHVNVETHAAPLTAELKARGVQTISEAHTEANAINEAMPQQQKPKKGLLGFFRKS